MLDRRPDPAFRSEPELFTDRRRLVSRHRAAGDLRGWFARETDSVCDDTRVSEPLLDLVPDVRRASNVSGVKRMLNFRTVATGIAAAAGLMLQGCYTYPAYVAVPVSSSVPARFDASWQAARAAASDEGVRITYEDRPSGTLRGDKGSSSVLITVVTQADGSIRVAFSVTGPSSQDVSLQDRLTSAYQRRMGR